MIQLIQLSNDRMTLIDWPDCEVSIDGKFWRNGKEKTVCIGRVGYKIVQRSVNNKTQQKYLHRVLLESFVGPCPDGCEALHINGDRMDNSISNLRWGTRKENVADAIRHGTATIGVKNSKAKFDATQVVSVRRLKQQGVSSKEIAHSFSVSVATIDNIIRGKTYTGVMS